MNARNSKPSEADPRGLASRAALLRAATVAFDRYGFDATSIRDICDDAGQNVAAVNYYFGGKQELYLAVAQEIADQISGRVLPVLTPIRAYLDGEIRTRKKTEAHLVRLITMMSRTVIGVPGEFIPTVFILREQAQPTAAFDLIFERFMRPIHETITTLVADCMAVPSTDVQAILHAHAIIGQLLGFRALRAALLKRTGWSAKAHPAPDHADQMVAVIIEHTLAVVRAAASKGRKS